MQQESKQVGQRPGTWSVWSALVAVLVGAHSVCGQVPPQQPRAQLQFNFLQGDVSQDVGGYLILPQPPRELRRALANAERAISERRYSEAVEALGEILDGPSNEDYFLPREDQPDESISLKQRARALLGSLPRAGREIYQLQVGSEARRLLNDALEQSDIDGLTEVSRRFFHSDVGYEATMLLGRYELDQGRPLAAALHLERLRKAPAAAAKFEPELSLLLAVCWQLAGQEKAAREVLDQHLAQLAGTRYTVAGEAFTLPDDVESLQTWITGSLSTSVAWIATETQSWPLFRGDAQRNPSIAGGMPLAKVEWALETATLPNDESEILALHRNLQDKEIPAIPAMQPLAIGDQLLMRTARIMLGVDLRTGRRVWLYPEEEMERPDGWNQPASEMQQRRASEQNHRLLTQRIWQDAPYSQMSSDGQRLFLLRDLTPANSQYVSPEIIMFGRQAQIHSGLQLPKDYNRLVALELATQGKTLWSVGGPDSHETQLTSAFFLGVPLPLDGHVYALAEIKDEIKLLCLEAQTGRLEWSQQLAQIEAPYTVHTDAIRRLAGATPSFADGVLVCPTSSGAVVAVELASRTLLWGHRYKRDQPTDPNRQIRIAFGGRRGLPGMDSPGNHWCDAVAVIEQGHVLLTPLESNRLHCLDLLTGKSLWSPIRREDMLFIGAVHEGVVLMVHKSRLRGLDLHTGETAWPSIVFKDGEFPTGRGFLSDGAYYLPTSESELLKVDLRKGRILERQPTERVLGNVICHGDYLISQAPDGVFAYSIRERKRASVMQQMALTPNDPELLEDYANLLASDGKTAEALAAMRRAIELQPDDARRVAIREALVRMVISALKEDFVAHQSLADEATQLAPTPQLQRELAWIVAAGLAEHAEPATAFAAYLELVDQLPVRPPDSPPETRKRTTRGEGTWRVAAEIDLALKIEDLLASAVDPAVDQMQSKLSDHVKAAIESQDPERLRKWLTISHSQPVAHELRRVLAETLIEQGRLLEAELLLNRLPDADVRQSLREQIFSAPSAAALEPPPMWPDGKVVASESSAGKPEARQWFAVELQSASHGWPDGLQLAIDSPHQRLVITDALGRLIARIPLQDYNRLAYRAAHARAYGHLLIVSLGSHLLAVDMLRSTDRDDERILWQITLDDTDSTLGNDLLARTRSPRAQPRSIPFDTARYVMIDANGSPYGQIGSVSDEGVCLIQNGDLRCLDPLTGDLKWIQRGINSRTTLFGDDQHVFACHTSTGETRVFQVRDGRQVARKKAPQGSRHWQTHGRYIVYFDGSYNTGRDLQVRMYDPWEERDVWTWSLAAKSKGCFVGYDELALMQPDGKFVVLRLEDGQPVFQAELEPENNLMPIDVFRASDQYLVITNRDDGTRTSRLRRANIQLQVPSSGIYPTTRITGRVYALDRDTGRPLWPHPVQVEQYWLLRPVPAELPVLVMLRQVRRQHTRPQQQGLIRTMTTHVVVIDRRSGSIAMQRLDLPMGTSFCSIEGDPLTNQIELRLPPDKTFVLQLTDQPVPAAKEPPRLGPVEIEPPTGANN